MSKSCWHGMRMHQVPGSSMCRFTCYRSAICQVLQEDVLCQLIQGDVNFQVLQGDVPCQLLLVEILPSSGHETLICCQVHFVQVIAVSPHSFQILHVLPLQVFRLPDIPAARSSGCHVLPLSGP